MVLGPSGDPGRGQVEPSWGQDGALSRLEAILEGLRTKMDITMRSWSHLEAVMGDLEAVLGKNIEKP